MVRAEGGGRRVVRPPRVLRLGEEVPRGSTAEARDPAQVVLQHQQGAGRQTQARDRPVHAGRPILRVAGHRGRAGPVAQVAAVAAEGRGRSRGRRDAPSYFR